MKFVTAFAERAYGPGWANSPVWYIVRDGNGALSLEALQPEEQTAEIRQLYDICEAAHIALTNAVEVAVNSKKGRRMK